MQKEVPSAARSDWSAERSALAADSLRQGGHLYLRVHGESMLPTIWPGDVLEIASCSLEDVRCADIVLAARDGRLFLHRFIAHGVPEGFRLRGDSMPGCDLEYPPEALLGRLVRRRFSLASSSAAILARALGLLLCYCGLARRIALRLRSKWRTSATSAASTLAYKTRSNGAPHIVPLNVSKNISLNGGPPLIVEFLQ